MTRLLHLDKLRIVLKVCLAALLLVGPGVAIANAQSKQLSLADILIALRSKKAVMEEKNKILTDAVKTRGITFELTPEIEKELDTTGANADLIGAIRSNAPKVEPKVEPSPLQIAASNPKPIGPPPDFTFYRGRAMSALSVGDLDGALIEFGKAIALKPEDATSYAERGRIYIKQDKSDLAIAEFSKAVERDPKDTASWFRRATLQEKLGKTNEALADYKKAVEADATNEPAKVAVARIQDAQTKAAEAATAAAAKSVPPPVVVPVTTPPSTTSAGSTTPPAIMTMGALNEYAVRLAMPVYSSNDRRLGIQGKVTVKVILDAEGKVESCEAFEGPKALRGAAEDAIKKSKFKPVLSNGVPTRASGYVVYNFVATP